MQLSKIIRNKQRGFTLIELLVVIGILAILLAITLIAINPARQFSQANDTKRRSDVNAILNAINQKMADNKGIVPAGITSTEQEIKSGGADICGELVPQYLAALPSDPTANSGVAVAVCPAPPGVYSTRYYVVKSATNNRITVRAPNTEIPPIIEVTR